MFRQISFVSITFLTKVAFISFFFVDWEFANMPFQVWIVRKWIKTIEANERIFMKPHPVSLQIPFSCTSIVTYSEASNINNVAFESFLSQVNSINMSFQIHWTSKWEITLIAEMISGLFGQTFGFLRVFWLWRKFGFFGFGFVCIYLIRVYIYWWTWIKMSLKIMIFHHYVPSNTSTENML